VAVATFVTTAGCLVAHFWPEAIARAFTADDALIGVTAHALRIATMMFWVVGFQIVSTNFFQSLGYAGKSIFMSLSRQVLFLIPLLLTLPSIYDLQGVWMSFPASDTIATLLTVVLAVMQLRKINQLQAEKKKISNNRSALPIIF
jgi:Na+-driven multidrug efflux pump